MEIGFWIGFVGVGFGLCVPIPQLIRIIKTKQTEHVALGTYCFLVVALLCFLWHAIHIGAIVFIIAQGVNLTTNSIVLSLLIRGRRKKPWKTTKHLRPL